MKLQTILFCLMIPYMLPAMDLFKKEPGQMKVLIEIFSHMNELDLQKRGYHNKSVFGERLGYLLNYPLEFWKLPETKTEKNIMIKWIKKLYTYRDDRFLLHMIDDLFSKIVKHDQLYICIKDLVNSENVELEEEKIDNLKSILIHIKFKRKEWKNYQLMQELVHKKNSSKWRRCLVS